MSLIKMGGHAVVLLCVLLTGNLASAKQEEFSFASVPAPDWAVEPELRAEPKHDASKTRYILVDKQSHLSESGEFTSYSRFRLQPKTSSGVDEESDFKIAFISEYQQLQMHAVDVYRDGERIDKLSDVEVRFVQDESQANEKIYMGGVTATFILDDIRVDDIIDVRYSLVGRNPIYGEKYFSAAQITWSVPVDNAYFAYIAPAGRKLKAKSYNSDVTLQKSREGSYQRYALALHDVEGKDFESDYPSWYFPYPWIAVSEFKSWADVSRWASSFYAVEPLLAEGQANAEDSRFTKLFTRLDAENRSDEQFTMAALRFVQEDIRYISISIGENSHKPHTPEYVLRKRYGDCKDKTMLLIALLEARGIKAVPALVSSSNRGSIAKELPRPNVFDHVIARVTVKGKTYWLDSTRSYQADSLDKVVVSDFVLALPITSKGKKLESLNLGPEQKKYIKVVEVIHSQQFGSDAELEVVTTVAGSLADDYRNSYDNISKSKFSRNLREYYSRYYGDITELKKPVVTDNRKENTVVLRERYLLEDFWEAAGPFVKAQIYHAPIVGKTNYPGVKRRKTPYGSGSPIVIEHELKLLMAAGTNLHLDNTRTRLSVPGLEYRSDVSFGEGVYQVNSSFKLATDSVAVEDIGEYIRSMKKIEEESGYTLTVAVPESLAGKRDTQHLQRRLKELALDK